MSLRKKVLALAAPAALLTLSACATGFPAQVQRFQAMPAPQGQSFYVQAADPENRGGLVGAWTRPRLRVRDPTTHPRARPVNFAAVPGMRNENLD